MPIGDLPVETFGEAAVCAIARKAIGSRDVAVTPQGLSSWNMRARSPNCPVAPWCCCRAMPATASRRTGGLGMNTGITDVHNLAWKLAALPGVRADERLPDDYERERRPIAQPNTDQSAKKIMKMGLIDAAPACGRWRSSPRHSPVTLTPPVIHLRPRLPGLRSAPAARRAHSCRACLHAAVREGPRPQWGPGGNARGRLPHATTVAPGGAGGISDSSRIGSSRTRIPVA